MPVELIRKVESYLKEVLNLRVKLEEWKGLGALPLYLQREYELYRFRMLEHEYLLAYHLNDDEDSPAMLKKQLQNIKELSGYPVILLSTVVTSYNRKRWIEQQIQFIVPGNQIYLPELGLDLREYFRASTKKARYLSPSTQSLVLYVLHSHEYQLLTTKALKEKTGYSIMTLNRVFDELLEHKMAEGDKLNNRERAICFTKRGRELWNDAKALLKSPVKSKKWISCEPAYAVEYKVAGLTALAEQTMLAEPRVPTIAMTGEDFKLAIQNQMIREMREEWGSDYQVEIWSYNPSIVTKEPLVDPLSLYLSLQSDIDTRTKGEIEKLMENFQ